MQRRSFVGHPNLILETLAELAKEKNWKFDSNPQRLWGENEWNGMTCWLDTPEFKSCFRLQQMPGCCAVLIAFYIDIEPYTQEAFDALLQAIEEAADAAGFGSVQMAQVLYKQDARLEPWGLALKRDWRMSASFVNAKSGNAVVYLTKDLGQPGKRAGLEVQL